MTGQRQTPLDELRGQLAGAVYDHLRAHSANLDVSPTDIGRAIASVTEDWKVVRNSTEPLGKRSREPGIILKAELPWRPLTADEQADRDARLAAMSWGTDAYTREDFDVLDQPDGDPGPPPERVSINDLLTQRIWWRMNDPDAPEGERRTVPIRIDDMPHVHRMGLLGWLRKGAHGFHMRYRGLFFGAPDDVFDVVLEEQPAEWIDEQPLVRELVYRTTPYGESPRTWNPLDTAPRDGTVIRVRRGAKRRKAYIIGDPPTETYARWGTVQLEKEGESLGWQELDTILDGVAEILAEEADDGGDAGYEFPDYQIDERAYHWEWRALTDVERVALQQWRSISEAPRDGTLIMTRLHEGDEPRPLRRARIPVREGDYHADEIETWVELDGTVAGSVIGEMDPAEWRPLTAEEREAYAGGICGR